MIDQDAPAALLAAAPPLRHPDRAAWNRALDHHLDIAHRVLAQARARATAEGDRTAEARAGSLLIGAEEG